MPSPGSEPEETYGQWLLGLARYLWLALPIGLGCFASPISMGWSTADGGVVLAEDSVVNTVRWFVPASAIALLALGAWKRRWFPHPIGGALVLFFCCGNVFFMGARSLSDGVVGPDGATYVFFHHTIFQGRTAYLGRVTSTGWFTRTVESIEEDEGEFGFNFAYLVRPLGAADDRTRVTITRDGLVLGMIGHTAFRGIRAGESKPISDDEVAGLSPFLLLGDSGDGVEADISAIVEKLRYDLRVFGRVSIGRGDFGSGTPTEAPLVAALDSPNAWVRGAARRIVEAGGADTYPGATKRLASAPK